MLISYTESFTKHDLKSLDKQQLGTSHASQLCVNHETLSDTAAGFRSVVRTLPKRP